MDTLDIIIILLAITLFISFFNTMFLLLMFFKKEMKVPAIAEVKELKRKKPMLADTGP